MQMHVACNMLAPSAVADTQHFPYARVRIPGKAVLACERKDPLAMTVARGSCKFIQISSSC